MATPNVLPLNNDSTRKKLTPSELHANLVTCIKARRAVMVHGDPGIGKSQIMQQVADALFADAYAEKGYAYSDGVVTQSVTQLGKKKSVITTLGPSDPRPWFKDVRAALLDAVDLRGLPMVEDGKAKWAIPDFLPQDPRGGIVFFDEINRGSEMTMNGLFSLCIPPYALGEYSLPQQWVPASAVNDKDRGARRLSSALAARFTHLDLGGEVNSQWLDDVCRIAIARDWHPMVVAFLRSFPHLLHKYNPDERVSPNPRGWEFVSDISHQNPNATLMFSLVAGCVGEAAATEFCAFSALFRKLPVSDSIFMHPETEAIPAEASVRYAIVAMLARRINDTNFKQALKYLARMPLEYNVCCVLDATRRNKDLQHTPEYTKWCVEHGKGIIL